MKRAIYGAVASIKRATASGPSNILAYATQAATAGVRVRQMSASLNYGTALSTASLSAITFTTSVNLASDGSSAVFTNNSGPIASRFSSTGFGTTFTNPALAYGGYSLATRINNAANVVSIASELVDTKVFAFSSTTGFGTQFTEPATGIWGSSNYIRSTTFNPTDTVIVRVAQATNGFFPSANAYAWSNATGFGTKYSMPPNITISAADADNYSALTTFHPSNNAIGFGTNTAGGQSGVYVYAWTDGTGFGTLYSTPISGRTVCLNWTANGNAIGIGQGNNMSRTSVLTYRWTSASGFGTAYSAPSFSPTSVSNTTWSNFVSNTTSTSVMIGFGIYIRGFAWTDASGYGTSYGVSGFDGGNGANQYGGGMSWI